MPIQDRSYNVGITQRERLLDLLSIGRALERTGASLQPNVLRRRIEAE